MPMRRLVTGVLALSLMAILGSAAWFWATVHQPRSFASPVEVEVPHGASSGRIALLLKQRDIIASPLLLRIYLRLTGKGGQLRSGYYRFEAPLSLAGVVDRLVRGDVLVFQVTIPEGLRTDEVLDLLANKTGVERSRWQTALEELLPGMPEGRLLPETYQYTRPLDPKRLLAQMIQAQQDLLSQLDPSGRNWEKLRIMASIIEKETALPEERPIVAAVIRNRLNKGMRLQMDPTVIYGIWKTRGSFSGNIRKADLLRDTPWNTYTRHGLPPTPIGNPGADALRAAAHPADSDALYFVADGSGGHVFASTLSEHQANVRRWIRIERRMNRQRAGSAKESNDAGR